MTLQDSKPVKTLNHSIQHSSIVNYATSSIFTYFQFKYIQKYKKVTILLLIFFGQFLDKIHTYIALKPFSNVLCFCAICLKVIVNPFDAALLPEIRHTISWSCNYFHQCYIQGRLLQWDRVHHATSCPQTKSSSFFLEFCSSFNDIMRFSTIE